MLSDGIQLVGSSTATNFTIEGGTSLPTSGNNTGELFYLLGTGLHIYNGTTWTLIGSGVATPGGNSGQLQYNNGGVLGGTNGITYTAGTQVVEFTNHPTVGSLKVGFLNLPRATSFNAAANGKRVAITNGITVPGGTYAAGDAFSFYNDSANQLTITQGTSMTLRQDGTANTGNRILVGRGTCFLWFNTSFEAIISGSLL